MKTLLLMVALSALLLACSGDCLSCHPKLKETIMEDARHKPMLGCIACHKENTGTSECGSDCFACHNIEKVTNSGIKEHRVIEKCRECHMQLEGNDIAPSTTMPPQSTQQPLKEFLLTH